MTNSPFKGQVICMGTASAPIIVLDEPLSFWGGYDPQQGRIVDQHHPQAGKTVAGRIMVLPASRGSAGTPAGIAESIRIGKGPLGIIAMKADINIVAGLVTVSRLYKKDIPFLTVTPEVYEAISAAKALEIDEEGNITPRSL